KPPAAPSPTGANRTAAAGRSRAKARRTEETPPISLRRVWIPACAGKTVIWAGDRYTDIASCRRKAGTHASFSKYDPRNRKDSSTRCGSTRFAPSWQTGVDPGLRRDDVALQAT